MDATWQALAREAGVAAEQIAIGVTALGKANYAQQAYYGQAFFGLSIGFERSAKLALVIDHALRNGGAFPSHRELRNYGHDLTRLFQQLDDMALRRELTTVEQRLPSDEVHRGIIEVLSAFATNVTRYYNLDFVTGDPKTANIENPVAAWHHKVTEIVLKQHYSAREQAADRAGAAMMQKLLEGVMLVRHHSVVGEPLNAAGAASMQTAETDFARPFVRVYVLQLARFVAQIMSELTFDAYHTRLEFIPHLSEFFGIFNNSDAYFRSRARWSIYPSGDDEEINTDV